MKIFNAYRNPLMPDYVYIKLNDKNFLHVGSYALSVEGGMEFYPASNDPDSIVRVFVTSRDTENFQRSEELDGRETLDIDSRYQKAIIRKVFER